MALTITDNPRTKIFTLCTLYVAQGIPFGYLCITLVAFMADIFADQGFDEQAISVKNGGFIALCTLPWAFKWAWGPVIDRFTIRSMGRRRPWIIVSQLLMILTIAAMLTVDDLAGDLKLLGWMAFVHNIFCALQDVAVDALAVDILNEEERGKANGFMFASKYLGTFIGAAGLGLVVKHSSLHVAMYVQICILLTIMMIPLLMREREGEKLFPWSKGKDMLGDTVVRSSKVLVRSILRAFSLRSTIVAVFLALAMNIGVGVLSVIGPILTKQLGWRPDEYTTVVGGWGVCISAAGCVLGGYLADKLGVKKMIALGSILTGVLWVSFGLAQAYWANRPFFISVMMAEAFLIGFTTVAFFSLAMGVSWPKVAATQFTAYMACMNLSSTLAYKLEPLMISNAYYEINLLFYKNIFHWPGMSISQIYLAMGFFQIVMLLLLLLIDPTQTRRVLGDGH